MQVLKRIKEKREFSVGNVEELIKEDTLEINDSKMPDTKLFILRIQWESGEVGTDIGHKEIARIVISQEVIR